MHNLQSADDTIQTIINWARARDPIRAVLLTSTRAIPGSEIDALSDYDVILVLRDIHPFVVDPSWLDDFGEVLIAYWDPIYPHRDYGIELCANVIQFTDGLKIDFTLWPVSLLQRVLAEPALPAELDAGYRVLLDKDRLTDEMLLPTGKGYIPSPPTPAAYRLLVNDFLSDAPYAAKCLWRGELMPSKWCLDYDMKHVYLRQALEWRIEIEHNWSLPVGNLGMGLRKRLPEETWSQVEQTYAGSNIADNWQALERTMELFRRVAIEVGNHLGYPYPDELHARVSSYIERIRQTGKTQNGE